MHHLRRGDYSVFRDAIKDDTLAAEAERVEGMADVSPQQSRSLIKQHRGTVYPSQLRTPAIPVPTRRHARPDALARQ